MKLHRHWAAMALLLAPLAHGAGFETFNQSTFARAAVLPALGQGAVLEPSAVQSGVALDWSNEFFQRANARETLVLDAETLRVGLHYRRGVELGIGRGAEWSLELPLIFTGGGLQDALIEGWHSAFGLPNSNRGDAPQDRYRIRYVRDGAVLVDLQQGGNGLGDLRIGGGLALAPNWTLRATAQLPTGSKRQLTGGHAGMAVWSDYAMSLGKSGRASLTLSAGASAATQGGPLSGQQRPLVALAGAALQLPLWGALDGVVQLNGHSKLYQGSSLDPLTRIAMPLTFGLRWPWQRTVLELAISEDLSVHGSPDFGVLLGISMSAD